MNEVKVILDASPSLIELIERLIAADIEPQNWGRDNLNVPGVVAGGLGDKGVEGTSAIEKGPAGTTHEESKPEEFRRRAVALNNQGMKSQLRDLLSDNFATSLSNLTTANYAAFSDGLAILERQVEVEDPRDQIQY
jgi:hypothetical protein